MAAKATAIGSASWISAEKENALQLLQNEKEEVVFPAQHQLEWLNEHMAEIFSKSNVDVSNVFKTPGKLRGKTPRTARKRNAQDARIPLSDVFSSKPPMRQGPQKQADTSKPLFEIARDEDVRQTHKSQVDSGYHDSIENETNSDVQMQGSQHSASISTPHDEGLDGAQDLEHRTTEGSFHSAEEDHTTKVADTFPDAAAAQSMAQESAPNSQRSAQTGTLAQGQAVAQNDFDQDMSSPSGDSSPERPLIRKSSLTFAALPAREPMKPSIGARPSRTSHVDMQQQLGSYGARQALALTQPGPSNGPNAAKDTIMSDDDDDENIKIHQYTASPEDRQASAMHSKSSTQRLHEKIDMLGKAPQPRPSKSIPSAAMLFTNDQRDVQGTIERPGNQGPLVHDDEDDWIMPLNSPKSTMSSPPPSGAANNEDDSDEEDEFDIRAPELIAHEARMKTPVRMSPSPAKMRPGYGHAKSASTATLASPAKAAMAPPASPAKSISVSNPHATTTPQGSPKRYLDLSASKSKLQSIMKTAKGLFTTSASASAAAKLETLSPNAVNAAANLMPGMYPNLGALAQDKPLPASPAKEVRRTRSSTEREKRKEKEAQIMHKMDEQLEKAREKERRKMGEHRRLQEQPPVSNSMEQPTHPSPKRVPDESMQQEPPAYNALAAKPARPGRPTREPPVNKAKPAPVSIRVPTNSQRMPANPSHTASNAQEMLPADPKRPGLTKKTSTASLQSSTGLKASVHGQPPKPRALLAAERKKEQDEREAQRKLEQKREIERKRAAQQEEARKQEQKQRAGAEKRERERVAAEQARRQAQQQAIERKRQEAARKAEQQRLDRAANEAARPSSRLTGQPAGRSLINHPLPTNPAKPAKRPLEEDIGSRSQAAKYGMGPPQGDAKRRKTGEDEGTAEPAFRPVVSGAPIRQSHLGKKPSIFNHSSYAQAPPPASLGHLPPPPSRAAPPQMQQYANGAKIPFADAPNPPTHAKTPVSMMQQKTVQTVKSSPQYVNGEAINLPEIPTDSEDEDSDEDGNAFPIPDWATPGHLTEQLIRQEEIDGDAVFGPIAPLKMEEIFAKGNKDRLKRLRDRTSSANWALSGDGLTLEEVRADREQRQRLRLEGGWRFGH
ncbi:hypothetical protein HRR83_001848 [Exophiala dermatitidis]|uniref:Inner centromere protein ARK-binding domain-containing protein n=1 Tax=Exophiala dermatitidis TaxID=5970 RepID=A0AAN6IY89_EXODE|nr:hypothetical protein HRR73_004979 [Exophiala dermatitidis]KAJ4523303.1 hypothetical protein HRR75_001704 [Exophiala dermatitidis]KAJ4526651.1 hypothetical protein HRR74_001851 [Exophiala dermatitidis]KAJ4532100.1 hypothetical protein HRR76_007099 [Exophiala dermatitidis]KAJ4546135.1 hypothetical protein HRR77_004672 [Exophiala dermatitidis]